MRSAEWGIRMQNAAQSVSIRFISKWSARRRARDSFCIQDRPGGGILRPTRGGSWGWSGGGEGGDDRVTGGRGDREKGRAWGATLPRLMTNSPAITGLLSFHLLERTHRNGYTYDDF